MHLMHLTGRCLAIGVVLCMLSMTEVPSLQARPSSPPRASQPVLEAAYLYNFIQFTEWPGRAKNVPVTVLVAGDNRVRSAMQSIASKTDSTGATIRLAIDPCSGLACLGKPQVVFIGNDQARQLQQWLAKTSRRPVLTVSDIPGFADQGGMIELVRRDDRLAFRINRKAIENAGLYVSAQLLQLGEVIDGEHP